PDFAHRRISARDQHALLQDRTLAARDGPRPLHFSPVRDRRRDFPDHRKALPGSSLRRSRSELDLASEKATTMGSWSETGNPETAMAGAEAWICLPANQSSFIEHEPLVRSNAQLINQKHH